MARDGERPGAPRAPSVTTVLGVVLVTVFVVVVAALAATTGPTRVFDGLGPVPDRASVDPPTQNTDPGATGREFDTDRLLDERRDYGSLRWVGTVVRGSLLALVVGALLLAGHFWLRRRPGRRSAGPDVDHDPDVTVVDPLAAVAVALTEDAEEQDTALSQGSPRNGIVEAWLRFEVQAARAGAPREPWETSTEFTLRLLDSVRADAGATLRLAELYRLARFSDHEVGEDERAAAADALRLIRSRLGGLRATGTTEATEATWAARGTAGTRREDR